MTRTTLNFQCTPGLKKVLGQVAATEGISLSRLSEMLLCKSAAELVTMPIEGARDFLEEARFAFQDFEAVRLRVEVSDDLEERLKLVLNRALDRGEADISISEMVIEMRDVKPGFSLTENWLLSVEDDDPHLWPLARTVRAFLIEKLELMREEGDSE